MENIENGAAVCPSCGGKTEMGLVVGPKHKQKWVSEDNLDVKKLASVLSSSENNITFQPGPSWRGILGYPNIKGIRCPKCQTITLKYLS